MKTTRLVLIWKNLQNMMNIDLAKAFDEVDHFFPNKINKNYIYRSLHCIPGVHQIHGNTGFEPVVFITPTSRRINVFENPMI